VGSRTEPRGARGALGVRPKLVLLVALPFSLSLVVLALFVVAGQTARRGNQHVRLLTDHAAALWTVELAADRYLDGLEDQQAARAARDQLTGDAVALERAVAASDAIARRLPPEEQRGEARLAWALREMVRRGAETGPADRDAGLKLREFYQQEIVPRMQRRIEAEVGGVRATARAVQAQNARLLVVGLIVASVLLLLGFAASWRIAARFSHALTRLTREARRVSVGDPGGPLVIDGSDEFGELARAFHHMDEALRRQHRSRYAFLAGVAHDLRNPLTALKLSAESLTSAAALPPEGRLRQVLGLMGRQVDRMTRMTSDLVDAARIEAGELDLQLADSDLGALVRDSVDLYADAARAHALTAHTPPTPVLVRCDAARIAQVLNNLVSNAIKYSPRGGRVEVTLTRADDGAVIAVSDEGDGVAAEELETIFEPFRRARTTEPAVEGLGLGLAIARRIAVMHGGSLDVESTPGAGATFRLRLPAAG
jgi:signal transduction histidine kinase